MFVKFQFLELLTQLKITTLMGGGDKIKILELDFLHLHEGVGHKMMKFGENQSSLA